jgi:polyisoprenoid-binding protein YceI
VRLNLPNLKGGFMKKLMGLSILLLTMVAHGAVESTLTLKPAKGDVQIEATGRPAMVKIKGKGEGPTGSLKVAGTNVTGDITFTLDSLDTGIDLRNEHMKEKYLETKKHPKATLTLKEVSLPAGWSKEKPQVSETKFKGELELHGEKRPVEGTFEVTGNKELKAKMELKISDYKIDIPSYLGVTVADTVKVQISSKELF